MGTTNIRPVVHEVFKEGTYALSPAFYTGDKAKQSHLELLVTKYLKDETITPEEIQHVYSDYKNWNPLTRFYSIPIISLLAMYSMDKPSSSWLKPY